MKALEGVKVLDLTHALAGPFCTYQLQLLGAEVIKVERPGKGDDFRDFGRPEDWPAGPSFVAVNGGKRSITIDLKSPTGVEVVKRLARGADVVVENLRPGAAAALGLGYEALKAENPRLVYCSISGFGQEGEMAAWPAYDHTIKAISGMMWSGADDDVPDQGRGFSVDCFSGYLAYAAILSALFRRERSGEGQFLDVAMLDSALVLMGVGVVRKIITGDGGSAVQPIVHDRPTVGPFRTTDGWLWLSANFQNHWESLCRIIGAKDLIADPRFADVRSRNARAQELREILAERIAPHSAADLEIELMDAGCPAAKVRTTDQTLGLLSVVERQMLQPTEAEGRPVRLLNAGFRTKAENPALAGPVPALGADTDAVLAEAGYSAQEIAGMRAEGVV
jgi:crotonobetainyl-CoA:carnitine CoA-transferase CaiB-like acyl-CoA transferase